ncbi:uncharacterized protein LOC132611863 [Lycium barbarum]|uniref:uncharacterized protein LOC132611863 n=1 Tax=Lycium barbarum TaxID=112863 RepID=UPI00293E218A|nr:uncharacterized protein LOC132611863 [Lycium barbarum]
MTHVGVNNSGKNWYFMEDNVDVEGKITIWEDIYLVAGSTNFPWLVGWDINVVLHEDDKIGGIPVQPQDYEDFAFCHLARTGSDHAPFLISLKEQAQVVIRPFRFLKFWTEHQDFLSIVSNNWASERRNSQAQGRVFETDPSPMNRMVLQHAHAELKKYLHFEEEFWWHKSNVTWFAEGDRNTRFFHNLVNGRRQKLQVKRIQDANGGWFEEVSDMAREAESFFKKQFSQEEESSDLVY